MYRRVVAPMLLAVGIWGVMALVGAGSHMATKRAMDSLGAGRAAWMLPVLPLSEWLLFVAAFFAVRICALRGGTRRECVIVGLSPMVLGAVLYAFFMTQIGFSALGPAVGIMTAVTQGKLDLGAMIAAREWTADFLGLAGTCVAATWLCLWVGRACPASASAVPLNP